MKFTIQTGVFKDMVQAILPAVPAKNINPVLAGVHIAVSGGKLTVSATDMEVSISRTVDLDTITTDGVCVIDAKKLANALAQTNGDVTFTLDDETVLVRAGRMKFTMPVMNPDEFPLVTTDSNDWPMTLSCAVLLDAFRKVHFASDHNENARFATTGVCWECTGSKIALVATDTKRLAMVEFPCESTNDYTCSQVLPNKVIVLLMRNLADTGEQLNANITKNSCSFMMDGMVITAGLVSGKFPPYRDIIPKKFGSTIQMSADELSGSLRSASVMTDSETMRVNLDIQQDQIVFTSSTLSGKSEVEMPIALQGTPLKMAFDPKFVIDYAKVCNGGTVTMRYNDGKKPIVFSDNNYTYLVMPMSE